MSSKPRSTIVNPLRNSYVDPLPKALKEIPFGVTPLGATEAMAKAASSGKGNGSGRAASSGRSRSVRSEDPLPNAIKDSDLSFGVMGSKYAFK